jgi:SAM-dependent methyltransferase
MKPIRQELLKTINLDLGCGSNKQLGFLGLDKRYFDSVDIVHDIEDTPWPIDENSVAILLATHILEHIDPRKFLDVMDEAWRTLIPDGSFMISVPHSSNIYAYQDPTHMRPGFVESSFYYFDYRNPLWHIYKTKPFEILSCVWDSFANIEVRLRAIKKGSKDITPKILKKYMGEK